MCIMCTHGVFDAKKAIQAAVEDYRRHTSAVDVLDEVSADFVDRLAQDSYTAKTELRDLFRKSPAWCEELQALVINGNRTHNPNYDLISDWIYEILKPLKNGVDPEKWDNVKLAARFFTAPNSDYLYQYLDALNKIAPKAYHKGRKASKIFKAMCDALGVTDNTKGSNFQKLYAQIADELSAKKINFKLYVSINPAHFLTMSNPKHDSRGDTMTSCHSFNCKDYTYNCGCAGYARDNYSFIVFTAADDNNPETLNNRKTSRQIFAYKPYNGVLLQSRMYTTNSGSSYGGVNGDTEEGKLYRDLIQREISKCEGVPNLWHTDNYCKNRFEIEICAGRGFGGYADWTYSDFGAKISVRTDCKDDFGEFEIGTYGLCIRCGDETGKGLFCECCRYDNEWCDECQNYCSETWSVHGRGGSNICVCEDCLNSYYRLCEHCDEYYHVDDITQVSGGVYVCEDCLHEHYSYCEDCGEYYPSEYMYTAINTYGDEISICENCAEYYEVCDECGCYVHSSDATETEDDNGNTIIHCPNCTTDEEGDDE